MLNSPMFSTANVFHYTVDSLLFAIYSSYITQATVSSPDHKGLAQTLGYHVISNHGACLIYVTKP